MRRVNLSGERAVIALDEDQSKDLERSHAAEVVNYLAIEGDGLLIDAAVNEIEPPTIEITSPNGGNKLEPGETVSTNWTDNFEENVYVQLYLNDTFYQTIVPPTASDGQADWTVATNLPLGDRYKIKIAQSGGNIDDWSDDYFTIESNLIPIPNPSDFIEKGFDLVQGGTWKVKGTGDFNGDGVDDIIWRLGDEGETHLWLMNQNGERNSSVNLNQGGTWKVKGTGDFNGDGVDDIIWRLGDEGETHLWLMNQNGERNSSVNLNQGGTWKVKGTGDFNEDGITDILWQEQGNGEVHAWLMNQDGVRQTPVNLGFNPGWNIINTGDFNGDNIDDLIW